MKLKRVLFGALLTPLLAACTDDGPGTSSRDEDYMRAFIKEFGVPAKGHDFSQARSAGLKVKASRQTHITVTAEIEGEEYLFGDLNVPAGLTAIPVTVPSDVKNLNIHLGMAKYGVPADGTVDLDNLPDPTPDSRYIRLDDRYNPYLASVNDNKKYYITFKYSEFLKPYFEEYPQGENYSLGDRTQGWTDMYPFECETIFGCQQDRNTPSRDYYVFPIYRRDSPNGNKHYSWEFGYFYGGPLKEGPSIAGTNFPELGYSLSAREYYDINFYSMSNVTFDTDKPESFPTDGDSDFLVISEGQYVTFYPSDKHGLWIKLKYMDTSSEKGKPVYSSANPQSNYEEWGDNYYRATLGHLHNAYGSTRRVMRRGTYKIIEFDTSEATKVIYNKTENAYIVGFSAPASKKDDDADRDFADAIFLIIPANKIYDEWHYNPHMFKPFYWTIAAEDLGGSFDWDFNDAVFRFTDVVENLGTTQADKDGNFPCWVPTDAVSVRKISVEPLAAGGTMPLYITYTGKVYADPEMPSDPDTDYYTANEKLRAHMSAASHNGTYIIGAEIHKWLGGSTHTMMLNTKGSTDFAPGKKITFAIPTDEDPFDSYWYGQSNNVSSSNKPLRGFAVLVDKENKLNIDSRNGAGFAALPEYTLGQDTYLIGRPDENEENVAPQMILIAGDGWEWPQECVNIKDAYPKFANWLKTINYEKWQNTKNSDKVTHRN